MNKQEDKYAGYIYSTAGASYVLLFTIFFSIGIFTVDDPFGQDKFYVKTLSLLLLYILSLVILRAGKNIEIRKKLAVWGSSILIHVAIITYVLSIFDFDLAVLVVMIPEIIIFMFLVLGIYKIIQRIATENKTV